MTARTPARRRTFETPELDRRIEDAESRTVIQWRGEEVPFAAFRGRVAEFDARADRERGYATWADALESLNPLYAERLAAWQATGDVTTMAAKGGTDPAAFAVDLERFSFNAETSYFAALRRYLALMDIEQGDASEADLWHIERGTPWAQWFGQRETASAVAAAGRDGQAGDVEGWRGAESRLGAPGAAGDASGVVGAAFSTLAGSPEWLEGELGMARDEVPAFADFAAFVRLMRLRRLQADLLVDLRLFATDDPALHRAYYSGITGHTVGVTVHEAGYLAGRRRPFASVGQLETAFAGAMVATALETRLGPHWWREPEAAAVADRLGGARTAHDAVAELGYDAVDWRPALRQIRTRLIGEMSGYGGPNITTRAGTRKV